MKVEILALLVLLVVGVVVADTDSDVQSPSKRFEIPLISALLDFILSGGNNENATSSPVTTDVPEQKPSADKAPTKENEQKPSADKAPTKENEQKKSNDTSSRKRVVAGMPNRDSIRIPFPSFPGKREESEGNVKRVVAGMPNRDSIRIPFPSFPGKREESEGNVKRVVAGMPNRDSIRVPFPSFPGKREESEGTVKKEVDSTGTPNYLSSAGPASLPRVAGIIEETTQKPPGKGKGRTPKPPKVKPTKLPKPLKRIGPEARELEPAI
ncbi:hypothetical protein BsWGS_07506 [Bradybaena similaris]